MVGLQVKSLGGDFSQFVSPAHRRGHADHDLELLLRPGRWLRADQRAADDRRAAPDDERPGPVTTRSRTPASIRAIAYNEAETSMFADAARTQFNVDGTGVTIGVLSDSVNQYNGGLVRVVRDRRPQPQPIPSTCSRTARPAATDEGRAMLENIHDIAPGANLAFATADGGDLGLRQTTSRPWPTRPKSNIIVDDVGYADEPMFQDGLIAQAVNTVTAQGVTYFSAAGNDGRQRLPVDVPRRPPARSPGIGTGTFMNFNPNGGDQHRAADHDRRIANAD